jgi:hypothetical protein
LQGVRFALTTQRVEVGRAALNRKPPLFKQLPQRQCLDIAAAVGSDSALPDKQNISCSGVGPIVRSQQAAVTLFARIIVGEKDFGVAPKV